MPRSMVLPIGRQLRYLRVVPKAWGVCRQNKWNKLCESRKSSPGSTLEGNMGHLAPQWWSPTTPVIRKSSWLMSYANPDQFT
jgi:hypothetical protein